MKNKILIDTAMLLLILMFSATAALSQLVPINCVGGTANSGTLNCTVSGSGVQYPSNNRLITGQVRFTTSNLSYLSGTGQFMFDAAIENLINQPLGTTNGTTADPSGIRVFFSAGPTVTGGTGSVAVIPDGFATFTAPGQPYYRYGQVLQTNQASNPRTFTLVVPPSVTTFSFQMLIEAAIQFGPTAASVSVSGRVLSAEGRSVRRAMVKMTDSNGNIKSARTNPFGYFHFNDVTSGQTYIFGISAKGYSFAPQIVTVNEELMDLTFTTQGKTPRL